jgi:hypothetical protein
MWDEAAIPPIQGAIIAWFQPFGEKLSHKSLPREQKSGFGIQPGASHLSIDLVQLVIEM